MMCAHIHKIRDISVCPACARVYNNIIMYSYYCVRIVSVSYAAMLMGWRVERGGEFVRSKSQYHCSPMYVRVIEYVVDNHRYARSFLDKIKKKKIPKKCQKT